MSCQYGASKRPLCMMDNYTSTVTFMPDVSTYSYHYDATDVFVYTAIEGRFIGYFYVELVLYFVSIFTNLLTIIVIVGNRKLRILSNAFFSTLAASDLAQALFGLTFNVMRIYGLKTNDWSFVLNKTLMSTLQFLWWFATNLSYSSLILISIERWLFIARPLVALKVNVKIISLCLVVFASLSLGGSFLSINEDLVSTNVGYLFPIMHTLISLLIVLVYSHIMCIASHQLDAISRTTQMRVQNVVEPCSQAQFQETTTTASTQKPSMLKNWKAIKMSVIVFTMYFFTVSPWTYFQAWHSITGDSLDKGEISQALNTVSCLHFVSNVFVYASQNKNFYNVLKSYVNHFRCEGKP